MVDSPIEVLCIGGTGQNGATLLSRMLGRLPGFVAVGELGYIWDRGLTENMACGCGTSFRQCSFWTRVGEEAFGGWDAFDARAALDLRKQVTLRGLPMSHPSSLPLIAAARIWPAYQEKVRRYAWLMKRLYHGIRMTSGASVIVDSMKQPYHVYVARRVPEIDLRVVHLVRDSRGVAYSQTKWVERQSALAGPYRVRRSPVKTGVRYLWINLAYHMLGRSGVPMIRVEYETFVLSPREEIMRIAGFAGARPNEDDLGFIHGDDLELPTDHLVAGNRMRLQAGRLILRVDDEWRTRLSDRHRRTVSLLTWPLLSRYGYVPGEIASPETGDLLGG